jgi:hypothetical protein
MKDEDKAEGFFGTSPEDCPGCECCQPKSPEQEATELAEEGLREEIIKIMKEELPGILKELFNDNKIRMRTENFAGLTWLKME